MSLIFPHNPTVAAKHNFAKLLVYGTSENRGPQHLTTQVGLEAINDRREAQLGMCHQVKKYTASVTAYTAVLGAPVAAVSGGTYYLLKDYIDDPKKVFTGLAANSDNSMFSGKNLLLGLAGVGLADRAIKKATGYAPIGSVISWTAHMLSSAVLYAAYKAGEMTTHGYTKLEKESEAFKSKANKTIFEQTKAVFDNVADDLIAKAEKSKDSPKELLQLKGEMDRLQVKMSAIKEGLKGLKLEKSEEIQILDKLSTTISSIIDMQFILRQAVTDVDHKYNMELMAMLTDSQFEGKELSFEVRNLVEEIKANTLGVGHAVKSFVVPMFAGFGTAATTCAAGSAMAFAATYHSDPSYATSIANCIMNSTSCAGITLTPEITVIALAGSISAVIASSSVFSSLNDRYTQEAEDAEAIIERNTKDVTKELLAIFGGIAAYLDGQKGVQSPSELKSIAKSIHSKIPQIQFAIEKTEVVEDASVITQTLEKVLEDILKA